MPFQIPAMNLLFSITGIVLVIAIIAIILILILLKLYQVKSAARAKPGIGSTLMKDVVLPVSPATSQGLKTAAQGPSPAGPEPWYGMELRDQGDISKNMQAFVEKYGFDSFTLSSDDGLVIASTSEDGQRDAANCSQSFRAGIQYPEPGILIFGMNHRGSTIIGIIKSSHPVRSPVPTEIEIDANNILKWGL